MTGAEALIVMQVGSAVMGAVGAMQQGNSANAAAQYNTQVANNNAIAARQAAGEDKKRHDRLTMKRMGTLRAGSASLDLLEDSAMQEELEALSILHGGEVQAIGFENTATLERARGKSAKQAGYMGAAGSLLKGAGGLALGGGGSTYTAGYGDIDPLAGYNFG